MHIAILTTEGTRTAADWLAAQAGRRPALEVDLIDLSVACLPDCEDSPGQRPSAVRDLRPWLAAADGFVVVTQERNRSFPGALKNAVDWFAEEWKAKPVAFVSVGADHAVEQLRLVFAAAHAVTVHEVAHQDESADRMLDQLTWWAGALRQAREADPYPQTRTL